VHALFVRPGGNKVRGVTTAFKIPLILAFSLREKGFPCLANE